MKQLRKVTRKRIFGKPAYKFIGTSIIVIIWFLLLFSACENDYYGRDGYPGDAYLALDWQYDVPEYIDAGTSDIPEVFEWGTYYYTRPGWYQFYYEGEHWNGYRYIPYAWEVDYEIWVNPGEAGDINYHGRDGMDNYFSIVCEPFGPGVYYDGKSYKKLPDTDPEERITEHQVDIGEELIVKDQKAGMSIKVIYTRVAPR